MFHYILLPGRIDILLHAQANATYYYAFQCWILCWTVPSLFLAST